MSCASEKFRILTLKPRFYNSENWRLGQRILLSIRALPDRSSALKSHFLSEVGDAGLEETSTGNACRVFRRLAAFLSGKLQRCLSVPKQMMTGGQAGGQHYPAEPQLDR